VEESDKQKIIRVLQVLNQIEVKGKMNAGYLVAVMNTLEEILEDNNGKLSK
jgi:hypothetical protein